MEQEQTPLMQGQVWTARYAGRGCQYRITEVSENGNYFRGVFIEANGTEHIVTPWIPKDVLFTPCVKPSKPTS